MDSTFLLFLLVVALIYIFEYINGFHDTANAIATVVATKTLTRFQAVFMAAGLNFLGAVLTGTAVATTVGKGFVDSKAVTQQTLVAALLIAIAWNLITWWRGLPSSSSHALLFGVLGAAVATADFGIVISDGLYKVLFGIVYSPALGLLGGFLLLSGLKVFFDIRSKKTGVIFGRLQLFSSAFMAFSHGGNDGSKNIGMITLALFTYGVISDFSIPLWVMVTSALAIGLGTAAGGWRIINTMAYKLTDITPMQGFAAETSAGLVIEGATRLFGMPISTTHAISSAIVGVGAGNGEVQWKKAMEIAFAWLLTPFVCLLGGYGAMWLIKSFFN